MGGQSEATVKIPKGEKVTSFADPAGSSPKKLAEAAAGFSTPPPADPPTISDYLVQGSDLAKRRRLLGGGGGRQSTFLTSPMGTNGTGF